MKPNVLLITIDALRADALGCYGAAPGTSPCIDNLASRGTRFEIAVTNGDHTKPSFPAIMTSTYGSMYTGCLGTLSPQRHTVAQAFRESGYRTIGISTSPLLSREFGYDRGFDMFVDVLAPPKGAKWHRLKGVQRLLRQPLAHSLLGSLGIDTRPCPPYASASAAAELAIQNLRACRRPFMAWVHFMDTHWPYHSPLRLESSYELSESWRDLQAMYLLGAEGVRPSNNRLHRVRNLYDAAIRDVDAAVAKIVGSLSQLPLSDNTLLVITSDHGEAFLEHGDFGHLGNLYEECIRVPLIMVGPGVPCNYVVGQPVQLLDLAPTLLDLTGMEKAPSMVGSSWVPLLNGQELASSPPIISEQWWEDWVRLCARTSRYKLIWHTKGAGGYEFYDLESDPGERVNLQGHAPELEEGLMAAIHKHTEFVRATQTEYEHIELDQAVLDRLAALGYVEGI